MQDQLKGVQQIQASECAFAAILSDGSVVTWGHWYYGGDSGSVRDQLKGVQQIQVPPTKHGSCDGFSQAVGAFAAILTDGPVVTWGSSDHGGNSRFVQDQLRVV